MERLSRAVGPAGTNVHLVADPATAEALAIDPAIPSLAWISETLAARGWTLKLIVNTHGHWDHVGDNAPLAAHTGAPIAVHPLDRPRLEQPDAWSAWLPFEIPPSVPAVELAEGGVIRFGEIRLMVLHTPGHTAGSACLWSPDDGVVFSGDTLFAGSYGRLDLPGAVPDAMPGSLARLGTLEDSVEVLPGHGPPTTIGRERAWLDLVTRLGRLPF
jgi:hydroxyacylglutathione hydrolase